MSKKQKYLVNLILTAILAAVSVVLGRFFSYNVQNFSIGFAFLPVMISGMYCGVLWGGVCGALADFIGAILFPFSAYFPGFTAVAFMMGAIYGLIGIADKKFPKNWQFCLFALSGFALTEFVGSLLLNSLWLTIMYGMPYKAELLLRLPEAIVFLIVKFAVALLLRQFVLPIMKKSFNRS